MSRRFFGLLAFAAALAMLVGALKALNGLPLLADKKLMRRYASIEEARTALSVPEILVPSYFPEDLRWPPATVMAQERPFPALIMEFQRAGGGDAALLIFQAASDDFWPTGPDRIRIVEVKERIPCSLKGRSAVLEVGPGKKGDLCARITWKEGAFRVGILARSAPLELIKVAESMLR